MTTKTSKKILLTLTISLLVLLVGAFLIGRISAPSKVVIQTAPTQGIDWVRLIPDIAAGLLGPLAAGWAIWLLGVHETDKKLKQDAIRDLMTYRGDYSGPAFTQSLNKVAIVFHDDEEIRQDIRKLYDVINNPALSSTTTTTRSIVGLIYKLCHKNGFDGLTEYDIDQSFVKPSQNPNPSPTGPTVDITSKVPAVEKRKAPKKKVAAK